MSRIAALRHYQRALAQWPPDVLRPDVSFQKTIQRRVERRLGGFEDTNATKEPGKEVTESVIIAAELEQANALFSLLENRYSKRYALSDRLLKPKSSPDYYKKMLKEVEEAPKRSWLSRKVNQWKGFLRLS